MIPLYVCYNCAFCKLRAGHSLLFCMKMLEEIKPIIDARQQKVVKNCPLEKLYGTIDSMKGVVNEKKDS